MTLLRHAVAAAAVLMATPASAMSAGELTASCFADGNSPDGRVGVARCIGYVDGMLDMHAAFATGPRPLARPLVCAPAQGISIEAGANAFLSFMADNMDKADWSARSAFIVALQRAYPCR